MYHKSQSYDVWFLRYWARYNFLSLWTIFTILPQKKPKKKNKKKKKKKKKKKNTWRYYHFTHAQHKWKSYDAWLLRYGLWQTEFLSFWAIFLPFYSTNNPKNQNFEQMKKTPGDIISLSLRTTNDDVWLLRYGVQQTKNFFVILDQFLLFYQKIKILRKW